MTGYDDQPNDIYGTPYVIATDHFVVAVGLGMDGDKPYVNVYDYLNTFNEDDRLFLTPLVILESEGHRLPDDRDARELSALSRRPLSRRPQEAWQQSGPQQVFASGFRARTNALAKRSWTSAAILSTSMPASARKTLASSTL